MVRPSLAICCSRSSGWRPAVRAWRDLLDPSGASYRLAIQMLLQRDGCLNMQDMWAGVWLRDRLWQQADPQPDIVKPTLTHIGPGTPEFSAWRQYKLSVREEVKEMDVMAKLGCQYTVPSRWPPGHEHDAVIQ